MKFDKNHPKLTAYALNELPKVEMLEVKRLLEDRPDLQREVEEIRQFSGVMMEELASEAKPKLTPAQKQRLASYGKKPTSIFSKLFSKQLIYTLAPLAACLLAYVLYQENTDYRQLNEAAYDAIDTPTDYDLKDVAPKKQSLSDKPAESPVMSGAKEANDRKAQPKPASKAKTKKSNAQPPAGPRRANKAEKRKSVAGDYEQVQIGVAGSGGANKKAGRGALGRRRVAVPATGGPLSLVPAKADRAKGRIHSFDPRAQLAERDEDGNDDGLVGKGMEESNSEAYDYIEDNPFKLAKADPLSTFSSDVDTASYANLRRFINNGKLPPKDAVRIEEMVNYFDYNYPQPKSQEPFSVQLDSVVAPWQPKHQLVRIGIKAKSFDWSKRPGMNLVFLLDVSGSMSARNKLPLLKRAFKLLTSKLDKRDKVSIVVYAGASGLVLPATSGHKQEEILDALDRLSAGGSTNGGSGIKLAYKVARQNFIKKGVNRVIIATDGDFNVGMSDRGSLVRFLKKHSKAGTYLSVLGFGMGNYKDGRLEAMADKGNGNYAYIDNFNEAKKVFEHQIGGTLITVAKDLKLQVEFNPKKVQAYRLIGYENRVMAHQDFNNDKKDAGDVGAGHSVTALYEIVPHGVKIDVAGVDALKYQKKPMSSWLDKIGMSSSEMLTVKIRYKKPTEQKSRLQSFPFKGKKRAFKSGTKDLRFAAAVAEFGMLLRDSPYKGNASFKRVLSTAKDARGEDRFSYRQEFIELVRKAGRLKGR